MTQWNYSQTTKFVKRKIRLARHVDKNLYINYTVKVNVY